MISIHLQGRLGNMMFQIAFLEYTGKRFGYETFYPNARENINTYIKGTDIHPPNPDAKDYHKIFKNFDWFKNEDKPYEVNCFMQIPFKFKHIYHVDDKTKFKGYFQSEQWWGGEREFMQELFAPSDFVLDKLSKYKYLFEGNVCAIHVRRGDYLRYPDIHPTVTVDYISRAKEKLRGHSISRYLIFSDDIQWCKEHIQDSKYVFIEGEKDYIELFLIGMCQHKIISNSTFPWWGSYLSTIGGITIAPKVWIADPKIDDSAVCPWHWKQL